jgi:RHS repeat-associated protein
MWIPEVGLYYYKARFYSPTLGRFMQIDPIGYKDGINWYAYSHNYPINGTDPEGTQDSFDRAISRDEEALLSGTMSEKDFKDRQMARGAGGVVGGAIVASAVVAGVSGLQKTIEIGMIGVKLFTSEPVTRPASPTPTVQNPPTPRQPTSPPKPANTIPRNPIKPKPKVDGQPNVKPVKKPQPRPAPPQKCIAIDTHHRELLKFVTR